MSLYPLLLLPEFHERVWGTRDLSLIYPHKSARQSFDQPIGEVWLTGEQCRVSNGPLAGQTLGDVTQRFGHELLGDAASDPSRFPLLLKMIFPKEKLSVQVHPDDEAARAKGLSCGKTECWYVLAAEPRAQVAIGFKESVTRLQVEQAINENRLEQMLNWVNVKPGEMIYVEAGTVHAIGPGVILVETQQNSDTTYRLYDYGRGRELHVRDGLAAMKDHPRMGKVARSEANGLATLVASPCFVVDKFVLRELREISPLRGRASVQVLVALDGCGIIEADGIAPVTFAKGEAVVLPANIRNFRIRPQWALECLRASLPGQTVPQPETTL
jgi:mannose-6-phosphate isomerase